MLCSSLLWHTVVKRICHSSFVVSIGVGAWCPTQLLSRSELFVVSVGVGAWCPTQPFCALPLCALLLLILPRSSLLLLCALLLCALLLCCADSYSPWWRSRASHESLQPRRPPWQCRAAPTLRQATATLAQMTKPRLVLAMRGTAAVRQMTATATLTRACLCAPAPNMTARATPTLRQSTAMTAALRQAM